MQLSSQPAPGSAPITLAPSPALGQQLERIALICLLLSTLLIAHLTLEPYNFQFRATLQEQGVGALLRNFLDGVVETSDVINNYVLFMPFGWSLACLLHRRSRPLAGLLIALVAGGALSLSVELLQAFLPTRTSSVVDVRSNSLGSALGWGAWALAGLLIRSWQRVALSAGVFLGLALAAIPLVPFDTSLDSWDRSYRLHVGNEQSGDRPWRGEVSRLLIAERSLSPEALRLASASGDWPDVGDASLLADYLPAGGGMVDRTGQQPALNQVGDDGEALWLATDDAARELSSRLAESSAFTIVATVRPASSEQIGPARIISLSRDISLRNFTLAQDGSDLVLRVRTPMTGLNGSWPQFRARGVFATTEPQRVAITYTGTEITLAVNGATHPDRMRFTYEWALVRHVLPPEVYLGLMGGIPLLSVVATSLPTLICLTLITIPAGLLVAVVERGPAAGRTSGRRALAAGLAAGIVAVFSATWAVLGQGSDRWEYLAFGLLLLVGSFTLFRVRVGRSTSERSV